MSAATDEADAVFRALADPTRRVILDELNERDRQTLFEICVRLIERHQMNLSRQAISKHLAVLEAAGLITTAWRGRTKIHSLHVGPIRRIGRGWLEKYLGKVGKRK